jgi:hypothetical protein
VPQASERLTDLRNALLSLHKTLLDSERGVYERDIARIPTSTEFLKLVLYDPFFNWLHELSELVVIIDEMRWTPFFGQKKTPSLDRVAALKIEESQCLKFARVTHPA